MVGATILQWKYYIYLIHSKADIVYIATAAVLGQGYHI